VKGYNANSIHVCYKGGVNGKDTRTHDQKAALERVLKTLKVMFPKAQIKGHRDFSPDKNGDGKIDSRDWIKICPCFDVQEFCKERNI
jgi:N-acetyl-anhydromuramyl-L-alanine amidase AmpD